MADASSPIFFVSSSLLGPPQKTADTSFPRLFFHLHCTSIFQLSSSTPLCSSGLVALHRRTRPESPAPGVYVRVDVVVSPELLEV